MIIPVQVYHMVNDVGIGNKMITYEKPRLVIYGSVAEITGGMDSGADDGHAGGGWILAS